MKAICITVLMALFTSFVASAGAEYKVKEEHSTRLKALMEMENHIEVLHYIDSLKQEGEDTREFSWLYANTLFQAGRLEQSRDSLLYWENDSIYSSRAMNLLTQIAIQQGDYLEAVKYLIRLSDRYPANPVYPHRLARAFNAMNQLPAAEGYYAQAHQLDTLNQVVIGEWVDVLIKLDFGQRAKRVLEKGIAVSPENRGFRRQRVTLAYKDREYDQTLINAEFLTQQGDTTPQIVKIKGFALFHLDSIDRAEFWVDYLIENGFVGEDVYFYKGKILVAKNQKAFAQPYFHLASISCMSANFNSFSLASGINLYETGQYQESIRWLQMTRHFSQNPIILFYLALNFYDYYEDKSPALTHFQLFLEQSQSESHETHREYAITKINEITEELHFHGHNP